MSDDSSSNAIIFVCGLVIGMVIMFFLIGMMVDSYITGFKEDAVKQGVGEFYLDKDRKPAFRFIKPPL